MIWNAGLRIGIKEAGETPARCKISNQEGLLDFLFLIVNLFSFVFADRPVRLVGCREHSF